MAQWVKMDEKEINSPGLVPFLEDTLSTIPTTKCRMSASDEPIALDLSQSQISLASSGLLFLACERNP